MRNATGVLLGAGSRALVVLGAALGAASCRTAGSMDAPSPVVLQSKDLGQGRCVSVNDAGQMVGDDDTQGAFLVRADGTRTGLGLRSGDIVTMALSINSAGQIAGFGESLAGRSAALWQNGAWMSAALPGGLLSVATAIGNDGALVGMSAPAWPAITNDPQKNPTTLPDKHAFLLPGGGSVQDLGVLGGRNSSANAIAAGGMVAGILETASGDTHAFLYSGGVMKDLGTLGGQNSAAYGVNTRGDVVGVSETSAGPAHAFLCSGGVMKDLGTLGGDSSDARAINDAGEIVGNSYAADGHVHPFRYAGGQMIDILPKDGTGNPFGMARAEAISPSGIIAGWGVAPAGASSAPVRCLMWTKS